MGGLVYVITSVTSFIISVSGTVTEQKDLSWRYLIIACLLLGIILIMHQAVKKKSRELISAFFNAVYSFSKLHFNRIIVHCIFIEI
jgi:4-hydroxybenzoate polyprenyltransferase